MIAHEMGLSCPAMDVNAACSGFMYAVRTAQGLLETGNKRVLVIGAEHLSRFVDWTDRNMAVLLADGAGAAVLEYDPTENDILSFVLGRRGRRTRSCSLVSTTAFSRWTVPRSFAAPCAWSWTRPKRPWPWRASPRTS